MKHVVGLMAISLSLSACAALFGPPMSPAEKQCIQQAVASRPDLTGSWKTHDGVMLDIRHRPTNQRALTVVVAANSPKKPDWEVTGAGMVTPGLVAPGSTACSDTWNIDISRHYPDRKPTRPGQIVSQQDRTTALLSAGADRIAFGGREVWTRVGAVGKLQLPKPGEATYDVELTGGSLATVTVRPGHGQECVAACQKDTRCAAAVLVGGDCMLKASVGSPRLRTSAMSWINPAFDSRPPPPIPPPGSRVREIRLTGTLLKNVGVGDRGADSKCARACEQDWACVAYSVETWKGECRLMRSLSGAERAKGWTTMVSSARTARVPSSGQWETDTRLRGRTLQTIRTGHGGLSACTAACTANAACKGVSWLGAETRCDLKADLGVAEPAQHWSSWAHPPRPPDLSNPPDQTMSSPLCKNHGPAFPAYALTTEPIDGASTYVDILGLLEGGAAKRPTYVATEKAGRVEWTKAFYVRPLPSGMVHIHSWYKPDLVLKRSRGDVVVGEVDGASEWRLEHLWEHVDPPDVGVYIVIRSPEDGTFLGHRGATLELQGSPVALETHWRYDELRLPSEQDRAVVPLAVQEPEPLILDGGAVEALANWAVEEYVREQQPSCWKKGGSGPCPSGQDTNCGLFCAQSTEMCVLEATEMVQSVSDIAFNIAGAIFTGGTANAGLRAARMGGKAAQTGLRQAMRVGGRKLAKHLRERVGSRVIRFVKSRGKSEAFKKLARAVAKKAAIRSGAVTAKMAAGGLAEQYLDQHEAAQVDALAEAYGEEVARRAAEKIALIAAAGDDPDLLAIAALVDPTGVMGAVDAFYKPTCTETPMPRINF